MVPDFLQFLAFYLIATAFLKILGSFLIHRDAGSALGRGVGWFVPGIA